jgi:hypothetical protein
MNPQAIEDYLGEMRGVVVLPGDHVEAVNRWQKLRHFRHGSAGDVVGGDGPEQRGGWMRRQV